MSVPSLLPSLRHNPARPLARHLLTLVCAATLLAGCATLTTVVGLLNNRLVLTAPQLQQYLDRRFPREYEQAGGLVTLALLNPHLSIPAGDTRLRLDFDIGLGGFGRDPRQPVGSFAVASALRFDAATRGLHLDNASIEAIDIPRLGGAMNDTGRDLVNRWLQDYSRDEPVYRIDDSVFAQLQPGQSFSSPVIENGLVVMRLTE